MRTVKLGEREVSLTRPADLAARVEAVSGLSTAELALAVRGGSTPVLATAMLVLIDGDKPARADLAAEIAADGVDRHGLGAALAEEMLAPDPMPEAPQPPAPEAPPAQEPPHGE